MSSTFRDLWSLTLFLLLMATSATASAQINYGPYTFPDASWFPDGATVVGSNVSAWDGGFAGTLATGDDASAWVAGYLPQVGVVNMATTAIIELSFSSRPPTNFAGPDLVIFDAQFDVSSVGVAISTDGTTFSSFQTFSPTTSTPISPRPGGATNVGTIEVDLDVFALAAGDAIQKIQIRGDGGADPFLIGVLNSDITPPPLSVVLPASGTVTNDDTPTFSGTSEANATVTVEIIDGTFMVVQTLGAITDMAGTWSVDATTLADGTYTFQVTASDSAGNESPREVRTITIDTVPPVLTLNSPADAAILASGNGAITGSSDPDQSLNVVVLDSMMTDVVNTTIDADSTGAFMTMFAGLADGQYTLVVNAQDAAGNSSEVTRSFTVDSVAPSLTITAPASMSFTNDSTPAVNADSSVDASVEVVIYDDSANEVDRFALTSDGNGGFTGEGSVELTDGDYTIEVTATRPNGLSTSESVDITVDTTAPELTISSPAEGMLSNDDTPTVAGTAPANTTVTVTITDADDAIVYTGDATADANGAWSLDADSLADGSYSVEASSEDEAGNVGMTGPVGFTIDATAPAISLTSPSESEVVDSATPTISGTGEEGMTVTISVDGAELGDVTVGADGAWTFDVTTPLTEGEHDVEATTVDGAGNVGSTGIVTFEVDAIADLIVTSPAEGDEIEGTSITVEGTGEPGSTVTITVGDDEVTTTVGDDGTWTAEVDGLGEGATTVSVTSGDENVTFDVTLLAPDDANGGIRGGVDDGCGCASTSPSDAGGSLLLALFGLFAIRRRKTH